jgi:hypothetical protein
VWVVVEAVHLATVAGNPRKSLNKTVILQARPVAIHLRVCTLAVSVKQSALAGHGGVGHVHGDWWLRTLLKE